MSEPAFQNAREVFLVDVTNPWKLILYRGDLRTGHEEFLPDEVYNNLPYAQRAASDWLVTNHCHEFEVIQIRDHLGNLVATVERPYGKSKKKAKNSKTMGGQ